MTVREGCAIFAPYVLVEVVLLSECLALVVIDCEGSGLADAGADDVVYSPVLEQARGIRGEL